MSIVSIFLDVPSGFRGWKSENTVIVGDTVILYCEAAPDYDLQWFLNDTKTTIKQDNKGENLIISREVASNDKGRK